MTTPPPASAADAAPAGQPAFVRYPAQAAFGRSVAKTKLYAHSHAGKRLKALFVQQVEQITWLYKLAPETVNLPSTTAVPEIQVFGIQLKTPDLHTDVLRAIDHAVQFPILFELVQGGRCRVVACHKRPSEAEAGRWVLSDYFASGWQTEPVPRQPMPLALHLGGLYEQLLRSLLPLPARPAETLAEQVARLGTLATRQREADQVAARLVQEKQFNRKLAINSELRRLLRDLDALRR